MKTYDLARQDTPTRITWFAEMNDLDLAKRMIKILAAKEPGEYFIYDESAFKKVLHINSTHTRSRQAFRTSYQRLIDPI